MYPRCKSSMKVIFVGRHCSGRTTLVRQILNQGHELTVTTLGVDVHSIKVSLPNNPSCVVTVQLFDTGNLVRFQPFISEYCRRSKIIFCCDTAQNVIQNGLKCMEGFETDPESNIVPIITKCDLIENDDFHSLTLKFSDSVFYASRGHGHKEIGRYIEDEAVRSHEHDVRSQVIQCLEPENPKSKCSRSF